MIQRRTFLGLASAASVSPWVFGSEAPASLAESVSFSSEFQWADVQDWGVEGKAFEQTEAFFDRLPAKAKGNVPDSVWGLSKHSAGMMVRFQTDAPEIHVDFALTSANLAMPHMPATGVSGLDLYARDESGQWKWVAVFPPKSQTTIGALVQGLPAGNRDYAIYLPLYNGTERLKLGVPKGSSFQTVAPRNDKPIVFYGTSITQGACASRPGMPHPAILGRRLDLPTVNLGFSGSGRMDLSLASLMSEVDAAVYVVDCLPNMTAEEVNARTIPFIHQLRASRPTVPILLVEDRSYSGAWLIESQRERNRTSRIAFQEQVRRLRDAGDEKINLLLGDSLLGDDRDDTTDGSHPSDLGFLRHANAFEPALRKLLTS
ncbi:MAG: SGNH/GDSL hydrolase family protein [Pirellula sp.]